ncbi:MAG: peroxiredoxin family protein [Hyphomicrobiaceae bacterium]
MQMGIVGKPAPELRVPHWIDANGKPRTPLKLADLGKGYKVIYCFQHWCPGCHSRGFPTLKKLVEKLAHHGFGFAVVQTVFEGAESNTFERLGEEQKRYGLELPFGHDPAPSGEPYPTVMGDYRTAGTPWFIIIDPSGVVVYNDFRLDADRFISALEHEEVVLE